MENVDNIIPHVNEGDLLIDFMDEQNFEQFIELIRGENEEPSVTFCHNYDCEHISGCLNDGQGLLFDYNNVVANNMLFSSDNNGNSNNNDNNDNSNNNNNISCDDIIVDSFPKWESDNNWEESSENTIATTPRKKSNKVDRSKTLVCERKRRGRMKEMLYTLRSLVPNITKMDKASIIADAVVYVQDLQKQAKKLKAEIASLESTTNTTHKYEGGQFHNNVKKTNFTKQPQIIKKIYKMEVYQVEESEFYVRLVSNKGQQVASSLYNAVDSLATLFISSSNLATTPQNYVFTFTFNVRQRESEVNLPNLKLWIASAFINQGFGFEASLL